MAMDVAHNVTLERFLTVNAAVQMASGEPSVTACALAVFYSHVITVGSVSLLVGHVNVIQTGSVLRSATAARRDTQVMFHFNFTKIFLLTIIL